MSLRNLLGVAVIACSASAAMTVHAANYPDHTVKLIVSLPPGSPQTIPPAFCPSIWEIVSSRHPWGRTGPAPVVSSLRRL